MQYLLLGRHGNTFAPTDKVVWVGAQNDLPLVESGIKQSQILAQALLDTCLVPQEIYAGPLKRALSYAQIIGNRLDLHAPARIDNRLDEIDYGKWSGLTDQEIREQFGNDELDQWQNQGIWPASFGNSEIEIVSQIFSFVSDAIVNQPERKLVLAISSNGRLKYFLKLMPNQWNKLSNQWKVSTGHLSLLAFSDSTWEIIAWNQSPQFVCSLLMTKFTVLADRS